MGGRRRGTTRGAGGDGAVRDRTWEWRKREACEPLVGRLERKEGEKIIYERSNIPSQLAPNVDPMSDLEAAKPGKIG